MDCRTPCKHILCPYTFEPWGSSQMVKTFFPECGHVAIKFKGKKYRPIASQKFDLKHTLGLWGRVERSSIEVVQIHK